MGCPNCNADIDIDDIRKACNLSYYDVPTDEISTHNFDCLGCGKPLSVSAEPEVSWYVHSIKLVPTKSDEKYLEWKEKTDDNARIQKPDL